MGPSAYQQVNTMGAKLLQINKQFVLTPVILVTFPRLWEDSQLWLSSLCRSQGRGNGRTRRLVYSLRLQSSTVVA